MTDALIVSNAILWVVVLALAGVILALVRQIGVLHERLAPAGALMLSRGPKVGDVVPVLDVENLHGGRLRIGEPAADGQGTLLLFVSPTCPVCASLLPVGVTDVESNFERGEALAVVGPDGVKIAHGLTNYASGELRKLRGVQSGQIVDILGYTYGDAVIHRNNMVLLK